MQRKQATPPETEQLKRILLEACERGELAAHMTAKDMVRELTQQLTQLFKGNES